MLRREFEKHSSQHEVSVFQSFAADKGVSRPAGFHHRPLAEPSVIEDVISRHELDSIANSFAVAAGLDIETVNNRLSFVRPSQETAYEAPSV